MQAALHLSATTPIHETVKPQQLHCRDKILDLSLPHVMGIINLTSTSFSETGRVNSVNEAVTQAKHMVAAGATLLDIGAEPTNPTQQHIVTEQEELARLLPVIRAVIDNVDVPISVDTSRPAVMAAVVEAGAHMINDVRALRVPGALAMAATLPVPICLMHMRHYRHPDEQEHTLAPPTTHLTIIEEMTEFLSARIEAAMQAGIARQRLVIDPGIGAGVFGKNLQENLRILQQLDQLHAFDLPILVGVSRKLFLGELLHIPAAQRMVPSVAAAIAAIQRGANIIRVHDVAATVQAMTVLRAIEGATG